MKRVFFHTLGCKLNATETATIERQFVDRGFSVVDGLSSFDVFVLNTCSVTERADRECRQLIRRALRAAPEAFVIVGGCYAQLQPAAIAAIGGVDLVLGSTEKFRIFEYVDSFKKRSTPLTYVSEIGERQDVDRSTSIGLPDRTRSFLKIQDGCDYSCSFCTIPLARGESRSIPLAAILEDARTIVEAGYKEIVLTGVNVGDFGSKMDLALLDVLRLLVQVEGIERIRISSVEPNLLSDWLLDYWFAESKICKHFHLPLQSGSDRMLSRMRRRYRRELYEDRVRTITNHLPLAGIGADVIVGFPGETEELFSETYDFLRDLPVSYLHVFPYSERPDTEAARMAGSVDRGVRARRSERLRLLSVRKRRMFHEQAVGHQLAVLFERQSPDGILEGLSGEYIRVRAHGPESFVNQICITEIVRAKNETCDGLLQQEALTEVVGIPEERTKDA